MIEGVFAIVAFIILCACKKMDKIPFTAEDVYYLSMENVDKDTGDRKEIYIDGICEDGSCMATYIHNGEEVYRDKAVDDKTARKIANRVVEYTAVVKDGKGKYWPDTDEYPPMLVLFNYRVSCINMGSDIRIDGACCKPEGYDEFFDEMLEIIGA